MLHGSHNIVETFSAKDAAAFSGLSLAMVNYLCRHGIVAPTLGGKRGRGIRRRYSFGDIVMIKAIAKLLQGGVSVYRLKRALARLGALNNGITAARLPAAYLVTNGEDVFFRHRAGVFELLSKGQFAFAFVVEMDLVRRDAIEFAKRGATRLAQRDPGISTRSTRYRRSRAN